MQTPVGCYLYKHLLLLLLLLLLRHSLFQRQQRFSMTDSIRTLYVRSLSLSLSFSLSFLSTTYRLSVSVHIHSILHRR
uniref:Putative secreted protein n=1 Tax=Anopheles darlingi TaxID=43151 RepID=A0A2M4D8P0_ANODA